MATPQDWYLTPGRGPADRGHHLRILLTREDLPEFQSLTGRIRRLCDAWCPELPFSLTANRGRRAHRLYDEGIKNRRLIDRKILDLYYRIKTGCGITQFK